MKIKAYSAAVNLFGYTDGQRLKADIHCCDRQGALRLKALIEQAIEIVRTESEGSSEEPDKTSD